MQQVCRARATRAAALVLLASTAGALTRERLPVPDETDAAPDTQNVARNPAGAKTMEELPMPEADGGSHSHDSGEIQDVGGMECVTSNAPDGIWKPPKSLDSSSHNICIKGKQVPDVYVLGAPKSASTTLAYELISAGTQCAGNIKEYHWFKPRNSHWYSRHPEAALRQWLRGMPACDAPHRALLGDYSPETLAQTALPGNPDPEEEAPVVLNRMYDGHGSKLNFVVLVREPLARAHSFAHYGRTLAEDVFQAKMEELLSRWAPDHIPTVDHRWGDAIWGSTYGFQMARWLRVFDHSQFYVIPFKAFVDGDANRICHDFQGRFHYGIDCGTEVKPNCRNSHPHTALDDETTEEFRDRFRDFMALDRTRLVELLAQGSSRGMGLALYDGASGDEGAIDEWLTKWW